MGGAWAELDCGAAECAAVRRAIYWSGSQKPLESCSDSSHPVGIYRAEPTIPQSVAVLYIFENENPSECRPVFSPALTSVPTERARSRGESHFAAARV